MLYFMTKYVFNSDKRLLGTCDFFKFLKKKFGKLFYLMNEIFDSFPFEEKFMEFYETKNFRSQILYILIVQKI